MFGDQMIKAEDGLTPRVAVHPAFQLWVWCSGTFSQGITL